MNYQEKINEYLAEEKRRFDTLVAEEKLVKENDAMPKEA